MSKRSNLKLLTLLFPVALACALSACEDKKPSEPPRPTVAAAPAEQTRTKEQAIADLMALPEVKAWSTQIEQASHGKSHGAVIEDDPAPRVIDGKRYWQFSFVENRPDRVNRRESFLVAQTGNQILIDDLQSNSTLSLTEWRRGVHRVELKAAQ